MEHLVDASGGQHAHRGHRPQMVPGRAAGVHRPGVEDGTDGPGRVAQFGVAGTAVGDLAGVGSGEADHHPHRGRLAGSVRADEAGDPPGCELERQIFDDRAPAVGLGEMGNGDHEVLLV